MKSLNHLSILVAAIGLFFSVGLGEKCKALDSAYGAYGFFPQGSARVIAMGGAFTGLSDDASASIYNPAGLAMARWSFDFSGDSNRIINKEVDLTGDNKRDGLPYEAANLSLAARWKNFGFALGQTDPYNLQFGELSSFSTKLGLSLVSQDISFAWAPSKMVSLGGTYHLETAKLSYEVKSSGVSTEDEASGSYYTVGVLLRPSRVLQVGLMYRPERLYDIDENLNTVSSSDFFHDVYVPEQTNFGIYIRSSSKLSWTFDMNTYSSRPALLYVGSAGFQFTDKATTIYRAGFEYAVLNDKDVEFTWRGGGYQEEPRVVGIDSRLHFTMGIAMRWGFITFGAAYDQASDFSTTSQSIGVSVSALKKEF
ncbi:MAG: hypothetical protein KDD61_04045 [Bdellovibrionales bacterium]|nr:hypothetical protein [Bdellovibrionales bacterium]